MDNGPLTEDGQTSPYHTLLESEVLERNESAYSHTQQGPQSSHKALSNGVCVKGCQKEPFKTGQKTYTQCKSRIKEGFGIQFIQMPVANIKLYLFVIGFKGNFYIILKVRKQANNFINAR